MSENHEFAEVTATQLISIFAWITADAEADLATLGGLARPEMSMSIQSAALDAIVRLQEVYRVHGLASSCSKMDHVVRTGDGSQNS